LLQVSLCNTKANLVHCANKSWSAAISAEGHIWYVH
jgi:hypothetical protein